MSLGGLPSRSVPWLLAIALSALPLLAAAPTPPANPCTVDILDASGAEPKILREALGERHLEVGHHGRLTTLHESSEVYFAKGCERQARTAAGVMGLADDAPQPLTWRTPYGVTVVIGEAANRALGDAVRACAPYAQLAALLRRGADPGDSAVFMAAMKSGTEGLLQAVVANGLPTSPEAIDALFAAAKGHPKFCDVLGNGALPDDLSRPPEALAHAAYRGDLALVRRMLACGSEPGHFSDSLGHRPLHVAKDASIAESLIERGANLEALTGHGWTPLHEAVYQGRRDVVEVLLRHGAQVNARSTSRFWPPPPTANPLSEVRYGRAGTLCDVGTTPLDVARAVAGPELAARLVAAGALPNRPALGSPADVPSGPCALRIETLSGLEPVLLVKALREEGLKVERFVAGDSAPSADNSIHHQKGCEQPARLAAKQMQLELGDPDGPHASGYGVEIVVHRRTPLPGEVSLKAERRWPWSRANSELESALERGVDPDECFEGSAMVAAAAGGNLPFVKLLLQNGGRLDCGYNERSSPLFQAVRAGHVEMSALLIDHGAPVPVYDFRRGTAFHRAARTGNAALVKVFLDRGAAVDLADHFGRPPLSAAASAEVARLLLDRGAAIDLLDTGFHYSPLHWAVIHGNKAVASTLLDRGAQPSVLATPVVEPAFPPPCQPPEVLSAGKSRGVTPLDLAQGFGESEIARLLESRGAKTGSPVPKTSRVQLDWVDAGD